MVIGIMKIDITFVMREGTPSGSMFKAIVRLPFAFYGSFIFQVPQLFFQSLLYASVANRKQKRLTKNRKPLIIN